MARSLKRSIPHDKIFYSDKAIGPLMGYCLDNQSFALNATKPLEAFVLCHDKSVCDKLWRGNTQNQPAQP